MVKLINFAQLLQGKKMWLKAFDGFSTRTQCLLKNYYVFSKKCFTPIHVKSGAQNRLSVPSWMSKLSIERFHNPLNESTSTIIILPTANAVWKTFCYRSVHRNKDLIDSGWNEVFNKTLNASIPRFMCFSICGKLFTFLLVHWVVKRINAERYVPQGIFKNTTSMP